MYGEMVEACGRAAVMMDDAAYDWHRLFEIEETLWPLESGLSATLSNARSGNTEEVRRAESDVRLLRNSLTWVQCHRYDALETEMQRHLDVALRSAMDALECLQTSARRTGARPVAAGNRVETAVAR